MECANGEYLGCINLSKEEVIRKRVKIKQAIHRRKSKTNPACENRLTLTHNHEREFKTSHQFSLDSLWPHSACFFNVTSVGY